jgi:hypothetical protein
MPGIEGLHTVLNFTIILTVIVIWLNIFFFLFVSFLFWGLNSEPTPWASPPALFCDNFFQDRGLFVWAGFKTRSSWLARITGVSYQRLASFLFISFVCLFVCFKTGSYYEVPMGFEFRIFLPQPHWVLRSQLCVGKYFNMRFEVLQNSHKVLYNIENLTSGSSYNQITKSWEMCYLLFWWLPVAPWGFSWLWYWE